MVQLSQGVQSVTGSIETGVSALVTGSTEPAGSSLSLSQGIRLPCSH